MIMDRITRETTTKLEKQLTAMLQNSRDELIAETTSVLKADNVTENTIAEITKVFHIDYEEKLKLIPETAANMIKKARIDGELTAIAKF